MKNADLSEANLEHARLVNADLTGGPIREERIVRDLSGLACDRRSELGRRVLRALQDGRLVHAEGQPRGRELLRSGEEAHESMTRASCMQCPVPYSNDGQLKC
eukprot:4755478-Pleurochrysis_carterae.AAC.1